MNITNISERITKFVTADLDYNNDKKEIITYGVESLLLSALGFMVILIVSYQINALVPTLLASFFGSLLRKLSGGAHFNSPLKCIAFGAIIYSILGVIAKEIIKYNLNSFIYLVFLLFCLIGVAVLAPVDCEAKPIHSLTFKRKLKTASIALILLTITIVLISNHNLLNTSAVLGIGYQTLTLLPVFNKKKKEV